MPPWLRRGLLIAFASSSACSRTPLESGLADGTIEGADATGAGDPPGAPPCNGFGPVEIARSPGAGDVVTDEARAYWGVDDGIWSVPLDGGDVAQLVSGGGSPSALAVDQAHVYWTETEGESMTTLSRVVKAGGAAEVVWSDPYRTTRGLVSDTERVYWILLDQPAGAEILSMSKNGGEPSVLATDQAAPYALAIDDARVYWINGGDASDPGAGEVRSVSKAGGPVQTIAEHQRWEGTFAPSQRALAVDRERVYWALQQGVLRAAPKSGGPVVTLAFESSWMAAIAVDEGDVYWGSFGQDRGDLKRAPVGGGAPETLTLGNEVPFGLALTSTRVVWTTGPSAVASVFARCK